MIRLRWPGEDIAIGEAAQLAHPRLRRLRGAGPWAFAIAHGGPLIATMQVPGWTAEGWPEAWTPGTDGCEFQIASNPPGIDHLKPPRIPPDAQRLDLACGERVWVIPARRAPRRLGFDGRDMGPATAYGVAAFDLFERMENGTHSANDILRVCLLALSSVDRRLLPEVCIGLGLFSDDDISPLLEAAWRIPKAPAGSEILSS